MDHPRQRPGRPICRFRFAALLAILWFAWMGAPSATLGTDQGKSGNLSSDSPGGQVPLQFHSERIRIDVRGDSVEVDGLYRFLSTGSRRPTMTLLFPYPEDSLFGGARTALLEEVVEDGRRRDLRFEELASGRGALWFLDVPEGDTLLVRTVYRQQILGCFARYIVTTTGFWSRPLVHARFEVFLPPEVEAPSFSYPFEVDPERDPRVWVYEASDFLPEEDIEIRWDCPR